VGTKKKPSWKVVRKAAEERVRKLRQELAMVDANIVRLTYKHDQLVKDISVAEFRAAHMLFDSLDRAAGVTNK
jgi:hypothetical protein